MRLIPAVILCTLLGVVYWIGATLFTDRIEKDIAQRSAEAVATIPDVDVDVTGRDVTLSGQVNTETERDEAKQLVDAVWGVRASQNQLAILKGYHFRASKNQNDGISLVGTIDDESSLTELRQSLSELNPAIDIDFGARPMVNSGRKLEIGTGALLLLNEGTLDINEEELVLTGLAADESIRNDIENTLITTHTYLAPLDVIANIDVVSSITAACRASLENYSNDNMVLFEVDKAEITTTSEEVIGNFATLLTECPGMVLIEAHADHDGSESYNLELSQRRAEAVSSQLKAFGIKNDQIQLFFYGETRPVASNESHQDKAYNRRVELQYLNTPNSPEIFSPQESIISSQSAE